MKINSRPTSIQPSQGTDVEELGFETNSVAPGAGLEPAGGLEPLGGLEPAFGGLEPAFEGGLEPFIPGGLEPALPHEPVSSGQGVHDVIDIMNDGVGNGQLQAVYEDLIDSIADVVDSGFDVPFPETSIDEITLSGNYLVIEGDESAGMDSLLNTVKRHLAILDVSPDTFTLIAIPTDSQSVDAVVAAHKASLNPEAGLSLQDAISAVKEKIVEIQNRGFENFTIIDVISDLELHGEKVVVRLQEGARFSPHSGDSALWLHEDVSELFKEVGFEGELTLRTDGPIAEAREHLHNAIQEEKASPFETFGVLDLFDGVTQNEKHLVVDIQDRLQDNDAFDLSDIQGSVAAILDRAGFIDIDVKLNGPLKVAANELNKIIDKAQNRGFENFYVGDIVDQVLIEDGKLHVTILDQYKGNGPFDTSDLQNYIEGQVERLGFTGIEVEVESLFDFQGALTSLNDHLSSVRNRMTEEIRVEDSVRGDISFDPDTQTFSMRMDPRHASSPEGLKHVFGEKLHELGLTNANIEVEVIDLAKDPEYLKEMLSILESRIDQIKGRATEEIRAEDAITDVTLYGTTFTVKVDPRSPVKPEGMPGLIQEHLASFGLSDANVRVEVINPFDSPEAMQQLAENLNSLREQLGSNGGPNNIWASIGNISTNQYGYELVVDVKEGHGASAGDVEKGLRRMLDENMGAQKVRMRVTNPDLTLQQAADIVNEELKQIHNRGFENLMTEDAISRVSADSDTVTVHIHHDYKDSSVYDAGDTNGVIKRHFEKLGVRFNDDMKILSTGPLPGATKALQERITQIQNRGFENIAIEDGIQSIKLEDNKILIDVHRATSHMLRAIDGHLEDLGYTNIPFELI